MTTLKTATLAAFAILTFVATTVTILRAEPPKVGAVLPQGLQLSAPLGAEERNYLGCGDGGTFKLSAVKADFVIIEVVGVYCPQCHIQAPLFDKFYARLTKDSELGGKVKMLGLAAGATKEEMEYLRDSGVYKYPVAWDPNFAVHKQLGEPKTPFTMVVDSKGKVLFAHMGIIEDVNAFYDQVSKLVR
ncbi:MAG: TlpA family protein disulfide reductase [Desulfovibrio sp.]|jgi:hypothetical protein|nr:TlpA family protein disulfide reductase [Desulfovibrio sp.]MBI4959799.1 TlpA family protein disulfide reductase [Desulfovibrio sp.]